MFVRQGDFGSWWLVERVTHTFDSVARSHYMDASLIARTDFPTDPPPKYPKVDHSRRIAGACLCREEEPELVGSVAHAVYGTGTWGTMPRWTARTVC